MPGSPRIAITGMGAIGALGQGLEATSQNLFNGTCGIRPITFFDCEKQRTQLAGEVPDFKPQDFIPRKIIKRLSRCDQLGVIAAQEALEQAGFSEMNRPYPAELIGVVLGAGAGGSRNGEMFYRIYKKKGEPCAPPSLLCHYPPSATTDFLANHFQFWGPRATVVTACSSSNTAMAHAAQLISQGLCDAVLTGGAEGLSELTYSGFNALRAISHQPCRPFDAQRDGLSLGEGAGMFVFENWEGAKNRGANILAEFVACGMSGDAHHMTAPDPGARGAIQAMRAALRQAHMQPSDIDFISAHGTATPHNDVMEAQAICEVFGLKIGRCPVPVSASKSQFGHCLGASAAIEAVAAILALQNQMIPPTVNHRETDPLCLIDCVPNQSRSQKINSVLSNSFAFGGNNTSVIFKRTLP